MTLAEREAISRGIVAGHSIRASAATLALETYDVTDSDGRYVRITGYGNTQNNWTSITEVQVLGVVAAPGLAFGDASLAFAVQEGGSTVDRNVIVYVGFDSTATSVPDWLSTSGFSPTALQIDLSGADVPSLDVYSRGYSAGETVVLGGASAPGAAGVQANYVVSVVEQ